MEFTETISSRQRQGQYDTTRYHGKYTFTVPALLKEDTISIDSATLSLVSTASGKSGARDLWLRAGHATDSSIIYRTGTTKFEVNRETTNTLTLNVKDTTTLSAIKNGKFGMYVNSSNDGYYFTDSKGKKYSSHYISFSSATLTVNYSYKAGTLNLGKTSVKIGSGGDTAVSATISNHISTYYYKLVVSAGGLSKTYNLGNASLKTLNFTETDYSTWVNGNSTTTSIFKEKTSVSGDITLKTYSDANYSKHLGDSKVNVTFTATLGNPTLTIGTIAYANSGKYTSINSFALPEFGTVTINHTASVKNGAAIKSITATQNFGTRTGSTTDAAKTIFTVNKGIANGTYEVSLTLTDTRGKTVSAKTKVTIKNYTIPTLSLSVVKNSSNKLEATYSYSVFTGSTVSKAYLTCDDKTIANFTTGVNSVSSTKYTYSTALNETEHKIKLCIEDSYGGKNELLKVLASTAFYLHFGSSGNTLGIGGAAPTDVTNKVRCYWDMALDKPLSLTNGGTEANSRTGAWDKIVAPGGTITGNLTIGKIEAATNGTSQLKSLYLNGSLALRANLNLDSGSGRLRFYDVTPSAEYKTSGGSIQATGGFYVKTLEGDVRKNQFLFYSSVPLSTNPYQTNGKYEYFRLPAVTPDRSSDISYDILTTKNYTLNAPSSPDIGSSSSITINGVIIEYGISAAIDVNKDSIQTYTLTFKNEFSKAPFIIATRFHNHSDSNNKKTQTHTTVWAKSVSTTSAAIALADDGGYGGTAVRISYIAIGNKK